MFSYISSHFSETTRTGRLRQPAINDAVGTVEAVAAEWGCNAAAHLVFLSCS